MLTRSEPAKWGGNAISIARATLAVATAALLGACSSAAPPVAILSTPDTASIRVNGEGIGTTPTKFLFRFPDENTRYHVIASKEGYLDTEVVVSEGSEGVQAGVINVALKDNPAWRATAESEATNKWLRIPIDPSIPYDGAWQRIIDSVTSVYDSLEQLDQLSGYVRSTPQLREFPGGPDGSFLVRTQFIGSVSSREPLTYKIKLVAQTRGKNDVADVWDDFGRVFAKDARLVEELQNRMGLK